MRAGDILYCRHPRCGEAFILTGPEMPTVCPECRQPAHWTTVKPFRLSLMDKRFLRSLRIAVDETDVDDRLGALEDDCA